MLEISDAILNTDLKSALIPFITAGYPDLDTTMKVVELFDKQGVQAIELGIPYSDALADGVVIQESSRVALAQKTYLDQVLSLVFMLNQKIKTPIIIFTYLNPVLSKGIEIFVKEIAQSGVKGLVIPDLPLEEADYLIAVCNYYCIELILFVAPSSSYSRISNIVLKAPGCIYLVSSYGVTGTRSNIETNISSLVDRIKLISDKPIMLGFGISSGIQISRIIQSGLSIDAIVLGTAFINKIKDACKKKSYDDLNLFCTQMINAIAFS